MRRISDWPIAARLSAGFGVVCVLLAAVVVVGWISLGHASTNSKQLAQLNQLSDGFRGFQTQIAAMQNLATTEAAYAQAGDTLTSGAGLKAHQDFARTLGQTSDAELKAIREQLNPAETKLFEAVSAPIGTFVANETKMFKAYQAGDLEAGNAIATANRSTLSRPARCPVRSPRRSTSAPTPRPRPARTRPLRPSA